MKVVRAASGFLRSKKRASNSTEASYRRYSNKKISTTFTLAGVLAASWQISYFLRRDCILRKREGRFSTSLFASLTPHLLLLRIVIYIRHGTESRHETECYAKCYTYRRLVRFVGILNYNFIISKLFCTVPSCYF